MKDSKIIGLLVIAVMSVVLFTQVQPSSTQSSARLVFPELKDHLSEINAIKIQSLAENDKRVSLTNLQSIWVNSDKHDYPADFTELASFVSLLSRLEIAETKTAKAENHARLGLSRGGVDAGTLITLEPGGFSVVVGKSGSQGSFVRSPDEDQVYLTADPVEASADPMDWVDPVVLNVDSQTVTKVSMVTQGLTILTAQRNEDSGGMELLNLPKDAELKYATIVDNLARVLVNLRFLDVEPVDANRFSNSSTTTVAIDDGSSIEVSSMSLGDAFWVHVKSGDQAKWQFEVSEYTYKELNKTMADMLKSEADDE
jgi:hypothetical protein